MVLANLRSVWLFSLMTAVSSANAAVVALPDPTQPRHVIGSADHERLHVDMIVTGKHATTIVINNRPYQIDDRISGMLITKVEQNRVHLCNGEENIILTLFPSS